jgi:hypothetical protein
MNRLPEAISRLIGAHAERRKLNIGLIYTGGRAVAEQLIASGHRLVVMSDRFHPMFRVFKKMRKEEGTAADDRVVMVETRLSSLPVGLEALDVLVLSSRLPSQSSPTQALLSLRSLLKPDGLLVWPQPVRGGIRGLFTRGRVKKGTRGLARREVLCQLAMEAGFYEIGQTVIPKSIPPRVITTGRRRRVGRFGL